MITGIQETIELLPGTQIKEPGDRYQPEEWNATSAVKL